MRKLPDSSEVICSVLKPIGETYKAIALNISEDWELRNKVQNSIKETAHS